MKPRVKPWVDLWLLHYHCAYISSFLSLTCALIYGSSHRDRVAGVWDPAFLERPPVTSASFLIAHNSSLWPSAPIKETPKCFLTSVSFQTQTKFPKYASSSFPHLTSAHHFWMLRETQSSYRQAEIHIFVILNQSLISLICWKWKNNLSVKEKNF